MFYIYICVMDENKCTVCGSAIHQTIWSTCDQCENEIIKSSEMYQQLCVEYSEGRYKPDQAIKILPVVYIKYGDNSEIQAMTTTVKQAAKIDCVSYSAMSSRITRQKKWRTIKS